MDHISTFTILIPHKMTDDIGMKNKLVYIEWGDAVSSGSGWFDGEEVEEWEEDAGWIIRQCGFIISETKKYIFLCAHIKEEDHFTVKQYGHLQKIPKTWIKKRVNLSKYL